MTQATSRSPMPFIPAALAAGETGVWDFDTATDRCYFCPVMASFLGLSVEDGRLGVGMGTILQAVHPDNREAWFTKRQAAMERGGLFIDECRVVRPDGDVRWLLTRGRYSRDPQKAGIQGKGVCFDITDSKNEGLAEDPASCLESGDDESGTVLDHAVDHVLEAHRLISAFEDRGGRLKPLMESLLLELGRGIAAQLVAAKRYDTLN